MPWATMSVTVPTVVIGLGVPAALFATPDFAGLRRIMAIPGAPLLALSLAHSSSARLGVSFAI